MFWVGFGLTRFLVIHHRTDGKHSIGGNIVHCFLTPWATQFIKDIIDDQLNAPLEEEPKGKPLKNSLNIDNEVSQDETMTLEDGQQNHHRSKNEEAIHGIFKNLMVLTTL